MHEVDADRVGQANVEQDTADLPSRRLPRSRLRAALGRDHHFVAKAGQEALDDAE